MGITLDRHAMALQLERAVRLAEDPNQVLPVAWVERTEHMAGCPSRTYVAALGVALLAKATDERIDALTVKRKVSANAYSMRGGAAVLAGNASLYGYHLGVTGPEPLNNQPWFHGERIDQFRVEDKEVEPFQNNLVRYLRELNGYDSPRALMALAAFVRVRQKFAAQLGAAQSNLEAAGLPGFSRLVSIAEEFIRSNPEGGGAARRSSRPSLTLRTTMSTSVASTIHGPATLRFFGAARICCSSRSSKSLSMQTQPTISLARPGRHRLTRRCSWPSRLISSRSIVRASAGRPMLHMACSRWCTRPSRSFSRRSRSIRR